MQASGALVSICIPSYNRGALIEETVRSVFAQTYANLELLVQDNASTDETPSVLARLAAEDPRVQVQRNAEFVSLPANHNLVVERARGDFVMVLSSDDLLAPTFVETCVKAMDDPAIDVVTTGHVWNANGTLTECVPKIPQGIYRRRAALYLMHAPFNINVTLFRRSALDPLRVHGKVAREPLISWDYDLWLRAGSIGTPVLYLPSFMGGTYRKHGDSISRRARMTSRHLAMSVLGNRGLLKKSCPFVYRYKLMRLITHNWRDWVRGRPVDWRLHRAIKLALCEP
jgi:glycosyltransferase involved in cell wall biosynthesis